MSIYVYIYIYIIYLYYINTIYLYILNTYTIYNKKYELQLLEFFLNFHIFHKVKEQHSLLTSEKSCLKAQC